MSRCRFMQFSARHCIYRVGLILFCFSIMFRPDISYADNKINNTIYRLCDVGPSNSKACVQSCRSASKNNFSNLDARQRTICEASLRESDAKNFKTDRACNESSCIYKFKVVDPYSTPVRFKGPAGYNLTKVSTYDEKTKGYTSIWSLTTPEGSTEKFIQCSTCAFNKNNIIHQGGKHSGAKLVNAGGIQGEDVVVTIPKK